ncbi:MAG TPA: FAD-binding protein, partial [Ferruginibacter sp.]|nr:FAD-binding protein [Ferruginibacter sp.]
ALSDFDNELWQKINAVITADGNKFEADAFILATGHSARDIFELLHKKQILIEAKEFALGVRIEHPQALIDNIQYGAYQTTSKESIFKRNEFLPPASYNLVQQVNGRGVFSFCMCPGGIIAPAATATGEIVVNGWSPSKRNNPFANSGIVVQVKKEDALKALKIANKKNTHINDPLLLMRFQQLVEQNCFNAGAGKFMAPAQRLADFCTNTLSATLPNNSYLPGLQPAMLKNVLPNFIHQSLAEAFLIFGKKLTGYYTNEAVVVATESRTSSPVRIPRHSENLNHPQLKNLYPCGEGAGFAGGIVSAAMDGERIARQLIIKI